MGKTSVNGAALLQLLLFHFSGLVGAVTISYFQNRKCGGVGYEFVDYPEFACSVFGIDGGSGAIEISDADQFVYSKFYIHQKCEYEIGHGVNNRCYIYPGLTGGYWWRPRFGGPSLADASPTNETSHTSNSQPQPTGIVFTDESTEGRWSLTTVNATEMYSRVQNIADAEKELSQLPDPDYCTDPSLDLVKDLHMYAL